MHATNTYQRGLFGRWIDRGHERVVMTAGSVLAGICLVGLANVPSLMGFYLAWAQQHA